ncbi:MAG: hypothetical protein P1U68_06230 [Verrucomicrobiales bacterium]|nr:hypothetical protein [Verrucomicrobiales bacterium]
MIRTAFLFSILFLLISTGHAELNYRFVESWLKLPAGQEYLGNSHGEIDVDSKGNVYISVEGESAGLQVFNPNGSYSHAVPNLPGSLHGFVIKDDFIYASVLRTGSVIKATLEGEIVLEIPTSSFPEEKVGPKGLKLTSVDVAPNGDIYVVDGYGIDSIFVFNAKGEFKTVFGGQEAPYNLDNCHKIFIDPRYEEPRILCCDRKNHRLLHLSLEGKVLGVFAEDLRRPSSASFHGDYVCIAEIAGRVSILDKEGSIVGTLGTNEIEGEINTNRVAPSQWRTGIVTAPHGIAFDAEGNILMSEWNVSGRVLRWEVRL